MNPIGIFMIVAALLCPLFWYVNDIAGPNGSAMFSQYIGSVAIISMAVTQMLSTRIRGLEAVFGGMDRIYVIHKWLGIIAIVTILIHDTIDAELRGRETFLTDLGETLGEVSLYGLLILVVITIVTFIPYRLWLWTHRFMGAFFGAGVIHFVLLEKPFDQLNGLNLYMLSFCVLGVVSYLYTLLPLRGQYGYCVSKVERYGSAVSVTLDPDKTGISHRAGQFAFLKFELPGLSETHPFTISCAPSANERLRFTIKDLGDYTKQISNQIKIGTPAKVSCAFGHFKRSTSSPEIWIAGGIGITPFLAWAEGLKYLQAPVHLFYCVRDESEAIHLDELKSAEAIDGFHFHLIQSQKTGRLTADKIAEMIGADLSSCRAYYCGPQAMRISLSNGLAQYGLSKRHFHYEEFEIRSGLGFRKLLAWADDIVPDMFGRMSRGGAAGKAGGKT